MFHLGLSEFTTFQWVVIASFMGVLYELRAIGKTLGELRDAKNREAGRPLF